MKKIALLIVSFFLLSIGTLSYAEIIIDTGPGPDLNAGWALREIQWLAAEFSLTEAYNITDVEGWMFSVFPAMDATAHISIYSGGSDVPVGDPMFSEQFTDSFSDDSPDWHGLSGLDWFLDAGTYWVAFEVLAGDSFFGGMPFPSSSPLDDGAAWVGSTSTWIPEDLRIGVRIQGASVPEPATMLLLGIGLFGLAGIGRKKIFKKN